MLSTAAQVGNTLGVAVIGIVFYGEPGDAPTAGSFPRAFVPSIGLTIGFTVMVAVLLQFLTPRIRKTMPSEVRPVDSRFITRQVIALLLSYRAE